MNKYSKIRVVRTTKSRSVDFSDLISPYQNPKPTTNTIQPEFNCKAQQTRTQGNTNSNRNKVLDSTSKKQQQQQHESDVDLDGEQFGVILSRNYSVSSFSSSKTQNFGITSEYDKKPTIQCAVRRVFSMRKSSAVAEDYCRIHDQFDPITSPIANGDDDIHQFHNYHTGSKKKKKNSKSKILKVCKSFLGL